MPETAGKPQWLCSDTTVLSAGCLSPLGGVPLGTMQENIKGVFLTLVGANLLSTSYPHD